MRSVIAVSRCWVYVPFHWVVIVVVVVLAVLATRADLIDMKVLGEKFSADLLKLRQPSHLALQALKLLVFVPGRH